jgi:PAS domain-containing protein
MESDKTAISNNQTVKEIKRLQAILDAVSSAIFEISAQGNILYANQAAADMFGYGVTEINFLKMVLKVLPIKMVLFLHYIKMVKRFLSPSI